MKNVLLGISLVSCVSVEKAPLSKVNIPYELIAATAFQVCAPMHYSEITIWGNGDGKIECKDNHAFSFKLDPIAENPDLMITIEHHCEDD